MRILQVAHGFPPQEWAGTELLTLTLSQALRARGHQVTVLARVGDTDATEFSLQAQRLGDLDVVRVVNNYTQLPTFRLQYENPFLTRPFLEVLARCRPDVVHFQHLAHLSVSLLPLTARLGYPTVLSLHDFFFACHRVHLIDTQTRLCPGPERGARCGDCLREETTPDEARRRFSVMERVLRVPQRILTPSAFLAQRIQGYFPFVDTRLRVVAPGLVAQPTTARHRVPRTPLRILYIGILMPHKGAHLLIEALAGLPPDSVAVSLYGAALPYWQPYIDRLQQAAQGLSVRFCGTYPHEQLDAILSQHDVLVLPSICEETFSLVTREALRAGLPVIAARRGALPEAVQDGVNGLLFEPDNAADLRRCLQSVLDEPELVERLRSHVTPIRDIATYAHEMEEIYQEIVPHSDLSPHPTLSHAITEAPSFPSPLRGEDQGEGAQMGTPLSLSHSLPQGEEEQKEPVLPPSPIRVSVCLPTYNGAEFIARAITSVLAQSLQDFELLIVDDCSTDATLEKVRSFADPRIRVYQNDRQLGIPGNWNRCLTLAQGEYVCLFHQDDEMLPENLARKVRLLEADPSLSFVHSAAAVVVEPSAPSPPEDWIEDADEDFIADGERYFHRLLFPGNSICAPAVVTRRQTLLDLGSFDTELGFAADYEMWMKLSIDGRVAFLSRPLLLYRWHGANASHAYRFERGVNETLLARQRAVRYYLDRTGRQDEGTILHAALLAVAEAGRRAVVLDLQGERQRAYIKDLEQVRDKLWADVQQIGKGWEDQRTYIEDQRTYIKDLEQVRDKLWADVQRQGQMWEEQQAYSKQLAHERDTLAHERDTLAHERDTLQAGLQRLTRSWEEQHAHSTHLEHKRGQVLSQRLRRLARKVWLRTPSA